MTSSRSSPTLLLSKALLLSWTIWVLNYFSRDVPVSIFPLWISFYFLRVFLSSLEIFSYSHYFSNLPSSMSKLIPLLSGFNHLCSSPLPLESNNVKQHMAHFMKPSSVQVRTVHSTQASQTGKKDPKSTHLTASVRNELLFSSAEPLHKSRSLNTPPTYKVTWRLRQEASARPSLQYTAVTSPPRHSKHFLPHLWNAI